MDVQCIVVFIDDRYTAMVSDEMVRVAREMRLNETILHWSSGISEDNRRPSPADPRRFSIVGKIKNVYHISGFFTLYNVPTLLWHILERRTKRCMVLFPSNTLQDRVGCWQGR